MFNADIPDSVLAETPQREKPSFYFVCPVCDVKFKSWSKRVCCSQKCRKKFLLFRIFYCKGCGVKVVNKKHIPSQYFCSKECRYVYRTQGLFR